MLECKSRGAYLMGLTTYGKYETEDQVNFTVYVPKVDEHFVGSLAVIPLQLFRSENNAWKASGRIKEGMK